MKNYRKFANGLSACILNLLVAGVGGGLFAQPASTTEWWHSKPRELHYRPDGGGFRLVHGNRRFNRALYGTNTGFRAEAGDLPEFALYLPGMGGNIRFALAKGSRAKWLTEADSIETLYTPGRMEYIIRDALLGKGSLTVQVLAMANAEGLVVKMTASSIPDSVKLLCAYGGVSGKKFSRDGDIGADPESVFYLNPNDCDGNAFQIAGSAFALAYGKEAKTISGAFPTGAQLKSIDARVLNSPSSLLLAQPSNDFPMLSANVILPDGEPLYIAWQTGLRTMSYQQLPSLFDSALAAAKTLAGRVKLNTPDPWINTLGGTLAMAADAIWEEPSYLHGAVAWRMRLPAWRGAYVADPLGWHDRARMHFSSYAKSQVSSPSVAPVVMDTALHLARHLEKMGTSMFSSGYICRNPNGDIRPHHYDMNLVFIDQLLTHFNWTGDTAFVRRMWPVIQRHLDWEKRNFDMDGDGLYDAYCCIWASDALQYSGGGVTHSSAYNYRAFSAAARLARVLGEDGSAYADEANKILHALQTKLWLPATGCFAEYKDLLGKQMVHPAAGLWTFYHAMEAGIANSLQAWQMTHYVDSEIPHIPVNAAGLEPGMEMLSTTNWMPYTWSINNVALAEQLHTSLAYWQAGRSDEAYHLWKSALAESMYLGASPGGFEQLSYYDAVRGELYRDFADPIGMAARSLVEGLFGIKPNLLTDTLEIQPGLPSAWPEASLQVPDISFEFHQAGTKDNYRLKTFFAKALALHFRLKARGTGLPVVMVNGHPAKKIAFVKDGVGQPMFDIIDTASASFEVTIDWKGNAPESGSLAFELLGGGSFSNTFKQAIPLKVFDPQQALQGSSINRQTFRAVAKNVPGSKSIFVQLKQDLAQWWAPVLLEIKPGIRVAGCRLEGESAILEMTGISPKNEQPVWVNGTPVQVGFVRTKSGYQFTLPTRLLLPGTNSIGLKDSAGKIKSTQFSNWHITVPASKTWEQVDIAASLNAKLTDIFEQHYLSPRPVGPTLQLPTQGIGNWCYPLVTAIINDSGFRKKAALAGNRFMIPQGIVFASNGEAGSKNIAFTSQWSNYPKQFSIRLSGTARHAYLLMAGSTNHMQSRLVNGIIRFQYADGTTDSLPLVNPENWWPIEQDYYEDGYAFHRQTPRPPRVYLQSGEVHTEPLTKYSSIKGLTNMAIEGGAATVLDLPLNPTKTLKSLTLETVANDVIIGLMGVTLLR